MLTPTKRNVSLDARAFQEDVEEDDGVNVETLHEYPRAVRHHGIVEDCHKQLAFPVLRFDVTFCGVM